MKWKGRNIFDIGDDGVLYYDAEAIKEISAYELGEEAGIKKEKKSIIANMLKKNMDIDSISSISGLSIDEINKLKMEIQKEKN